MADKKLNQNIKAFIERKDAQNEAYTTADIEYISQYNPAEGQDALYSFFTPGYVGEKMFELANHHGYDGGPILEPAVGNGNLLQYLTGAQNVQGFEIDPTNHRIATLRNPGATIYNQYFETAFLEPPRYRNTYSGKGPTWLSGYPYSLVFGNPPYGRHSNRYASYFKKKFYQLEAFFIIKGIQLLKKGGLLVYITSSNFLRTGKNYTHIKQSLENTTELIDAYRMPNVFQDTDVQTDIIILKRDSKMDPK